MTESALCVRGLSFAYGRGRPALDNVGFDIETGRFTALLGANGAGKTTLMALVTRLFRSPSGEIRVCGHDLARDPRAALACMGVVFQRPTLDLDLTVKQNLVYAASLYGLDCKAANRRIGECLERLGMAEHLGSGIRKLSGGMRRRIELARALLHEPRLLVLDEPTVGLDIASRKAIVRHAHDLCRTSGLAVLWTTHLIDEIEAEDGVVLLASGKVRASGGVADVLEATGAGELGDALASVAAKARPAGAGE
ncbi:MAG: ABC transporter ATP-binding protein [Geminicoccaceae bacterium]